MREHTIELLTQLGLSISLSGFMFICDCIELIDGNNEYMIQTCKLYEAVGKKHKVSMNNVSRNINYSFEKIFLYGNLELIQRVFRTTNKLPSSQSLGIMYNTIKKEINNGN